MVKCCSGVQGERGASPALSDLVCLAEGVCGSGWTFGGPSLIVSLTEMDRACYYGRSCSRVYIQERVIPVPNYGLFSALGPAMECSPSSRSLQWAAGAQLRNHQNPASQRASLASAVMCLPAVLLVFGIAAASAAKAPLDSFIPLCSKSDPKLNECVTKSAQLLLPAMAKGIRDYNMPPVEPLKLPFLSLSQSDKPVGLKLNISGTSHEGISGLKFLKSNIDLKKNHWELHLNFPRYSIIGTCDLGGRILLLPIVGHGPCNLTSLNMDAIITTDVAPYKNKNGKEYYKINNFRIKLTFHGGSFALEGLFGGNKELGSTMVRFLNENALDVFNEMKSTIQDVFSDVFGSLVARLFTAVPIEGVFKS